MGVERAKKNVRLSGRFRDAQPPFQRFTGFKPQSEDQRLGDQPGEFESLAQLIDKPTQDEQERFDRFDPVLEFKRFDKPFRWPNELERPRGRDRSGGKQREGFQTEPVHQRFLAQREQFADRGNPPLAQNHRDIGGGFQGGHGQSREECLRVIDDFDRFPPARGVTGDIGSGAHADSRAKILTGQTRAQSPGPRDHLQSVRVRKHGQTAQVERADARRGGLDVWRETVGALDDRFGHGGFLRRRAMPDEHVAASGHRLSRGQAFGDAVGAGQVCQLADRRRAPRRVNQRDCLGPQLRLVPQSRLERELWNVNNGEHNAASRQPARDDRSPTSAVLERNSVNFSRASRSAGGRANESRPRPPSIRTLHAAPLTSGNGVTTKTVARFCSRRRPKRYQVVVWILRSCPTGLSFKSIITRGKFRSRSSRSAAFSAAPALSHRTHNRRVKTSGPTAPTSNESAPSTSTTNLPPTATRRSKAWTT